MKNDALKPIANLIENCDLMKAVLPKAADWAASWGHEELSDWHCFPVLIREYKDHPATKAALNGKSIEEFGSMLERLVKKEKPIQSITSLSPLIYRLIYTIYSDATVLNTNVIEPFHFYLAFLSRPLNVVYSLYEFLKIDVMETLWRIIDTAPIKASEKVFYCYTQLHDTCLVTGPEPIRHFKSNADRITFVEQLFPTKLPHDATIEKLEYTSRLGYDLRVKLKVPDCEVGTFLKDLEPFLKVDRETKVDANTICLSLPSGKGSGKVTFDRRDGAIYIACSSNP
jgi:hypothetical protein